MLRLGWDDCWDWNSWNLAAVISMRCSRENGVLRPNFGPTIGCQTVPQGPSASRAPKATSMMSSKIEAVWDASRHGEIPPICLVMRRSSVRVRPQAPVRSLCTQAPVSTTSCRQAILRSGAWARSARGPDRRHQWQPRRHLPYRTRLCCRLMSLVRKATSGRTTKEILDADFAVCSLKPLAPACTVPPEDDGVRVQQQSGSSAA